MEKKQEGFATYLCVQAPKQEITFEQTMIEQNRQLKLLSIQRRGEQFYFEIQDKKDFLTLFSEEGNEYALIRNVLFGIVECLEQLGEYLLKPDSVILKPETIFLDTSKQVYLCYIPGFEGNIQKEFCGFMEYLMKHVNHKEDRLVVMVYGIYHIVREQQYSLLAVREFMEEREQGQEAQKNQIKEEKYIEQREEEIIRDKDIEQENSIKTGRDAAVRYQINKQLHKVKKQCILSVMAAVLLLFAGITLYENIFVYHTMAQGALLPIVAAGCLSGLFLSFYKGYKLYKMTQNSHIIMRDE